jgi:hypothetical protein
MAQNVSVADWVNSLFRLVLASDASGNALQIYQLLKPLTSYFDRQMTNFPSSSLPYIKVGKVVFRLTTDENAEWRSLAPGEELFA